MQKRYQALKETFRINTLMRSPVTPVDLEESGYLYRFSMISDMHVVTKCLRYVPINRVFESSACTRKNGSNMSNYRAQVKMLEGGNGDWPQPWGD